MVTAMVMTMDLSIQRRTNPLKNVRMTRIADSSKNQFIHKMTKFTFDRITEFQLVE